MTEMVNGIVIDASAALEGRLALIPAVWAAEIANDPLVNERRKRIRQPEVRRFVELLKGLSILENGQPFAETVNNIPPLARGHDLSAYEAAYLDVVVRHGAPLATIDTELQNACRAAGVKIFRV